MMNISSTMHINAVVDVTSPVIDSNLFLCKQDKRSLKLMVIFFIIVIIFVFLSKRIFYVAA